MKKLAAISSLVMFTASSIAADIGVRAGRHDGHANFSGITLNTKLGVLNTEFAYDGTTKGNVERISAMGVFDLPKVGPFNTYAKVGVGRLSDGDGTRGNALMYGVAASYPMTKSTTFVVDVIQMNAAKKINGADGTAVTAGVKFTF